jgi:sporulation protein YlmC with PRC-barrel domain
MLIAASAFTGTAIEALDGIVGHVKDLLFDDTTWKIRWLVVDTGHWLSSRRVLLHPSAISDMDHGAQTLRFALTRAQIEASPDLSQDEPVSQQMQHSLYDYYGWNPLWGVSYFGGNAMASPLSAPPYFGAELERDNRETGVMSDQGDPELRSVKEVTGYHIAATDGDIGHVDNLLIDDETWGIRYLIVSTHNWWPGKQVLLSPFAVTGLAWSDRHITVDVSREQVKTSPTWDPAQAIDSYYEHHLHEHYRWPGYGW